MKLISLRRLWLKILRVKGQTSYQAHQMRDEYFIGVFKVPYGEKHRLSRGWYIELATGYPREHDITRYEDNYGRDTHIGDYTIDTPGGVGTGKEFTLSADETGIRVDYGDQLDGTNRLQQSDEPNGLSLLRA